MVGKLKSFSLEPQTSRWQGLSAMAPVPCVGWPQKPLAVHWHKTATSSRPSVMVPLVEKGA